MSTSPSASTSSPVGPSRIHFVRGKCNWLCPSGSRYLSNHQPCGTCCILKLTRLKRRPYGDPTNAV